MRCLWLMFLCIGSAALYAAAPATSDTSQQILVMLHLPAAHFRPGETYGGSYAERQGKGARHRIASELAHDFGLTLVSDWPMPDLGVDCYVMLVPDGRTPTEVAQTMSKDKRAEWVQPMNTFHALSSAASTGADSLHALQPSVRQWHVDELHKASTGRGVRVAIVDSGVDATHPDLAGRVAVVENFVDASPFVPESHGTAVAGIIGARADDRARTVGIAPQAGLLALRACWEAAAGKTLCNSFSLAKALQFAIHSDAQVINLSLAGPEDRLLASLVDIALKHGSTIVGAVDAHMEGGGFPASHPGVLAVEDAASRSSDDPRKVLFAPGDDVPSAAPGARWGFVSGSSFAAAHVAGMVALVRELSPATTMRDAGAWARLPPGSADGPAGSIDACATLRRAAPSMNCVGSPGIGHPAQASW
jgi:subtilisin family serine protease